MSQREREIRKAKLLGTIQQQRLDLSACRQEWLVATAPWDRGWMLLQSMRSWALAGSGVMAVWGLRHPRFIIRWAKRGVGLWSSWRVVRRFVTRRHSR